MTDHDAIRANLNATTGSISISYESETERLSNSSRQENAAFEPNMNRKNLNISTYSEMISQNYETKHIEETLTKLTSPRIKRGLQSKESTKRPKILKVAGLAVTRKEVLQIMKSTLDDDDLYRVDQELL